MLLQLAACTVAIACAGPSAPAPDRRDLVLAAFGTPGECAPIFRVINAASVVLPVGDSAEARNFAFTIESPIVKAGVWFVGDGEQVQDTVRPVAPSPAIWPDTVPTVTSPELGGVEYHRDIYRVYFDDSTSAVTINAFLATFNATVIGGLVPVGDPTNPGYYVQIPDPGAAWAVVDSIGTAMRNSSGVRIAGPLPTPEPFKLRARFPSESGA